MYREIPQSGVKNNACVSVFFFLSLFFLSLHAFPTSLPLLLRLHALDTARIALGQERGERERKAREQDVRYV